MTDQILIEQYGNEKIFFDRLFATNSIDLSNIKGNYLEIQVNIQAQTPIYCPPGQYISPLLEKLGIQKVEDLARPHKLKTIVEIAEKADLKVVVLIWNFNWFERFIIRPIYGTSSKKPNYEYKFNGKYSPKNFEYHLSSSKIISLFSELEKRGDVEQVKYKTSNIVSCEINERGQLEIASTHGIWSKGIMYSKIDTSSE